jgi:hypothetical protein
MVEKEFPTPGHPFPMQGPALKRKLNEIVSPHLARFGVDWLGDYRWVQPGDIAIRRIVNFVLMKGAGAIISWGYSFSFVPAISGQRLTYHRTLKSAKADLLEFESSYVSNVTGGPRYREVIRDAGYFDATLDEYLREVLPQIEGWWERTSCIDEIEAELEDQCRCANFHHPSPKYVLAFIMAARSDRTGAKSRLDEWLGERARFSSSVGSKLKGALAAALAEAPSRWKADGGPRGIDRSHSDS